MKQNFNTLIKQKKRWKLVEGYLNGNKAKEFYGIYDKSNDEIGVSSVDAEEKSE